MTTIISPSNELVFQLADIFSLMGDPTRLRILVACLEKPISVSEIAISLNQSQPLVSHHLRLLKAARMVRAERRGKQVFYMAADHHVRCVISDMVAHYSESIDVNQGLCDAHTRDGAG